MIKFPLEEGTIIKVNNIGYDTYLIIIKKMEHKQQRHYKVRCILDTDDRGLDDYTNRIMLWTFPDDTTLRSFYKIITEKELMIELL